MEFRVGVGEWKVVFYLKFLTQRRRDAEYAEVFSRVEVEIGRMFYTTQSQLLP